MESIRHAASVIKNSPRLMRRKLEGRKTKHEPLQDDWLHQREHLMDGVVFYAKRLGSKCMQGQGKDCTDIVVKEIVEDTKKKKVAKCDKKLQKVAITISVRTLKIEDIETKTIQDEIPIYRISYCTADANFPKVFAFISKVRGIDENFCHAFLTTKSTIADAIAVTVSQTFSLAFELQKTRLSVKRKQIDEYQEAESRSLYSDIGMSSEGNQIMQNMQRSNSVDVNGHKTDDDNDFPFVFSHLRREILIERLESDPGADDESDPEFFRFVEQRTKPTILSSRSSGAFTTNDVMKFTPLRNSAEDLSQAKSVEDLLA